MIFTDRTITVRKGESRIDEPIVVYRGDYELEVRFTILNSRFKFMSGTNMIESEKASYGQLAILTPYGGNIFSDIVRCNDGSVTFVLTAEMLNQIEEVGLYSFQIRLMDYNKESRVSIPPIEFGIEVREPIASEDHDNSVNNAIVGYSIAKVVDPKEENVGDTFDESGNYNKTKWETGDRISQGKLNKIEDAIDKINKNEVNNAATLSKRIDNNFNVLDSKINSDYNVLDLKINEVAEKGTTVDVLERTTKNELERMIDDGTIANLTIADNSITTEKYKDESITNSKVKGLNFNEVNTVINEIVEDVIISANEDNIFCKKANDVGLITYENGEFYYTGNNAGWDSPIIRSEKSTKLTFTRGQDHQVYLGENMTGITTLNIGVSPSYISNRSAEGTVRIMEIPNSPILKLGTTIKVEVAPTNNHVEVYELINDAYILAYEFDIPEEAFCYNDTNLGLMIHKVNDYDDKMVYKDIKLGVSLVHDSIWDIVEPKVQDKVDSIISSAIYSSSAGFNVEYVYMYSDDFNTGDNDNVEVTSDGSIYYRGDYSGANMPSVMFNTRSITVVMGDCWHCTLGGSNDGYTTMNMKNGSLSNRNLTTSSRTTIQEAGDLQGETGDSITITRDGIRYIITNNTKNITLEFDLDTGAYAHVSPGIGLLCHSTGDGNKHKPKYTNITFHVEKLNIDLEEMILNSVQNNITIDNSGASTSIWAGKKWVTLGDSITARNHYQEMYNEVLKCRTVVNYGVGGTCIAKKNADDTTAMCVRYANMDDDADLVTVWGGVNDFGGGQFGHPAGIPMGDINSTELTTFYGAMKALVAGLQAKYLTAKIAFIITPPINGSKSMQYSGNNSANSQGHYLREYCEVIKEICELNSIPYIDMYRLSGFNDSNIHIMTATKDQSTPDGLHPSLVGFEYMQNKIVTFLNSL